MQKKIIRALLYILVAIIIFVGLFFLSRYNRLLFHFTVEFSTIVFGVCLFIIPISTIYLTKNMFMIIIGSALFTSSIFDFFHTISYQGLDIFAGYDSNLTLQLWSAARFFQIAGMLAAIFIIGRLLTKKSIIIIAVIIPVLSISLFSAIFLKIIPPFYIENTSIDTPAGNITGYIIAGFGLLAILLYSLRRKKLGLRNYFFIISALSFFFAGQVFLLFNLNYSGNIEVIVHYLKLASFYFMYNFLIESNLRDPYTILINNLKGTSEKLQYIETYDNLTGLINQPTLLEELKKQYEIAKRFKKHFSVIMIDIDDIKEINDRFGHPAGDDALKYLSDVIQNSVRGVDIKGRYGGDEFIISPIEVSTTDAIAIAQKIQENLAENPLPAGAVYGRFYISAGISGIRVKRQFDEIIAKAYKALLKSKKLGKNRITLIR